MKILMIAPQPFFQPRGTPFSVLHRVRVLSELGHSVDLMTYPIGESPSVPNVNILRARGLGIKTVKVGPSLKKFPLDLMLFSRVSGQLKKQRYDAIHTHEEACFVGAWVQKTRGLPHIYDMHSSLPQQLENYGFLAYSPMLALGRALERWTLRHSTGVIAICEALQEIALKQKVKPESLFVIHNRPVDEGLTASLAEREAFRAQFGGKKVILYTGTFEANQGLDLLLAAFRQVQDPEADLVLVGGTPEQVANIEGLAQGLEGRVQIVGRRPVQEMSLWMDSADVLVSPRSRGTNTPLKIYSYLAAGKAILATDLWTHRQVLDDQTALLASPTVDGLADGIRRLLADAGLRDRLATSALRVAEERYSPDRYREKHRRMLHALFPRLENQ